MVGHGALFCDAEDPGFAKPFDQTHDVWLFGCFTGVREQKAHQSFLALRAVGGVLAQTF